MNQQVYHFRVSVPTPLLYLSVELYPVWGSFINSYWLKHIVVDYDYDSAMIEVAVFYLVSTFQPIKTSSKCLDR